ncbi:hypothetical protein [Gynurincola endophyticus]|jgi:uncharacterized membrane protein YcaP (DUF421 family)|uniref:hypothetical protein n=1 Tax=Gynurincola endophyticus TaxID=2479004 RepID=UPI000F8EA75E|nr:hypothetical protein [Gynurincola endophyticus]
MLQTSVTLSVFNVLIGIGIAIALVLWLWNLKTKALKKRIVSLEREMLSNHAEILELKKEKTKLELLLKKENPSIFTKEGKVIESALKSI